MEHAERSEMEIAIISPLVVGIGQTPSTYSSQQINLARCWAKAGHRVTLITGRCDGLKEALNHERIRVVQRPMLWLGGKSGLPLLLGGLSLLGNGRYDFVLSSEHYQPTTLMTCIVSPNVVIYQGQNSSGSSRLNRLALRFLEAITLPIIRKRYQRIIAKTHSAEEFVRARGFGRCVTVPCGFDSNRFRPPSKDEKISSKMALGLNEGSRLLVYAGNLLPRRDLATAIKALADLRENNLDVELFLAGEGPDLPKLKNVSKDEGVEDFVHFLGVLSWEDLRQLYWAGDIFVFPTHYEIFGMVLVEALACGLRIVSTPCPAAKDIFSECSNAGLMVPLRDSPALGKACRTLFEKEQNPAICDDSIFRFLATMSWDSISTRILNEIKPQTQYTE